MNDHGRRKPKKVLQVVCLAVFILGFWYWASDTRTIESPVPHQDPSPPTENPVNPPETPRPTNVPSVTQPSVSPESVKAPQPSGPTSPTLLSFGYNDGQHPEKTPSFVLTPPEPQPAEKRLACPVIKLPKVNKLPTKVRLPTIAYSIVVHKRADLLANWLELTHDPENFYMIHVDAKSDDEYYKKIVKLAAKYENVKINPDRYQTIYYGWSVMWNHLSNFHRIKNLNETRDYFINVSGMELPIQTRREIRFFLGEHEPMSFIKEYCVISEIRNYWISWTWAEVKAGLVVVNKESRAQPAGITFHYGNQYGIYHKQLVLWMLDDLRMMHLIYWLRNTKSPEDVFFATAALNSPFKDSVFTYNNLKYIETDHCCTGSLTSRSTPCTLGVCDMARINASVSLFLSRVDSVDDPKLFSLVRELIEEREKREERTGKVKRIPMVPGQTLEPEYAPLPQLP